MATVESQTNERRLLKQPEVAELLSISYSMVRKLVASGELRSVKIGGARRVPVDAINDYLSRLESEAGYDSR